MWLFSRIALTATIIISAALLPSPASAFLMWKAERGDTTIHILAKIEMTGTKVELAAPVEDALQQSDLVVFEFQMDPDQRQIDQKRVVQSAMYKPGDNLVRHLPRDAVASLNKLCEKHGINNNALVRVKPWAAGYKINQIAARKAGVEQANILEGELFKLAAASGKAADYLTKPDEIIALYGGLTADQNVAVFKKHLTEAQEKKSFIEKCSSAWNSGDADAAAEIINDAYKNYPELIESVLAKQNAHWSTKLADMSKYDEGIFAIVPLENTVGPDTILQNLEKEGFTVSQVSVD